MLKTPCEFLLCGSVSIPVAKLEIDTDVLFFVLLFKKLTRLIFNFLLLYYNNILKIAIYFIFIKLGEIYQIT